MQTILLKRHMTIVKLMMSKGYIDCAIYWNGTKWMLHINPNIKAPQNGTTTVIPMVEASKVTALQNEIVKLKDALAKAQKDVPHQE